MPADRPRPYSIYVEAADAQLGWEPVITDEVFETLYQAEQKARSLHYQYGRRALLLRGQTKVMTVG